MKVTAFNKYTGEKIYEIELRLFGYHRFDVSCPDYTPEHCYIFCPQFDDQEAR